MNDASPSKRPMLIVLSVTSLIAVLGLGGYLYWRQKPVETDKTRVPPVKNNVPVSVNTLKTPTAAEVLTVLFGVKATANQITNATDQLSSFWFEQSFAQGADKFHAVFIKTQAIDPDTKAISDSHADGANISVVVYQLTDQHWQLYSKQINVGSFGAWGDVPEIKQVPTLQLSPDQLAFLIESGSTGQGYTDVGKGLLAFNPKLKTWKDLGFVQTGGDNAGACDDSPKPADDLLSACWQFSGEITLTKTAKNPAYPDLRVKQKGTTSDDNNKIVSVTDRLYVFNGEQYAEPGAEAR